MRRKCSEKEGEREKGREIISEEERERMKEKERVGGRERRKGESAVEFLKCIKAKSVKK